MTAQTNTHNEALDDSHLTERMVSGRVLRAARLSAGLSPEQLAVRAGVDEQTIHSCEKGHESLASLPVTQLDSLKAALRTAGAQDHLTDDLDTAAWCDVVAAAITEHDDLKCLLADPLASEATFGELLAWAISGHTPSRFSLFDDNH